MASWSDIVADEPSFSEAVQGRFDAHRHKVIATLRRDGAPRVSGTEATFAHGELWLGMMAGSRKALDLRREPRMAIHSATADPEMAEGDAKIAGRAIEITDRPTIERFIGAIGEDPGDFHLFRVNVTEVVLVTIGHPPDHLVIESWHEGTGLARTERR